MLTMKHFKLFIITLFIIFSSLTGIAYAESLKFAASTYEGEVKKGKAHGVGIFTFSDGSTYEGKVSKNRIHGKGIYTDNQGKVYDGKFKYGINTNKLDKNTRVSITLKPKTGVETSVQIRGSTAALYTRWFEAEEISSGTYALTVKGKTEMESAISSGGSGGDGGGGGDSGGGGGGGGC